MSSRNNIEIDSLSSKNQSNKDASVSCKTFLMFMNRKIRLVCAKKKVLCFTNNLMMKHHLGHVKI